MHVDAFLRKSVFGEVSHEKRLIVENDIPDFASFKTTGGTPLEWHELQKFRLDILGLAESCGFPESDKQSAKANFDCKVAIYLRNNPLLDSGEAFEDEVWAYLATFLMPDLTYWRFGNSKRRFHGGIRNTFYRLWYRAVVFDHEEYRYIRDRLLQELTEDAFQAILERPAISSEPKLACAVGAAWLKMADSGLGSSLERIMRTAIIRIRLRNQVCCLGSIEKVQLDNLVLNEFAAAVDSTSLEPDVNLG